MLVLSRRMGESLVIDGVVVLTILGVTRGAVRVGIEAPLSVDITRSELLEKEVVSDEAV
jgi:carbon storage regulator